MMSVISRNSKVLILLAALSLPISAGLAAQEEDSADTQVMTTVYGSPPADLTGLPAGPEVEGFISARRADRIEITGADGTATPVVLSEGTQIRASKGFLGLNRTALAADSLVNGLPVTVETVEWNNGLVASAIRFKNTDLKTASIVRNGTAQGFAEQTAATEALRGRLGDIDKYNVKSTTSVNFDTGKSVLSSQGKADLCATAAQAEAIDNALLLVVGYTDSTGSEDLNQALSEKRASRVVNYLQQACGWKPYRMLTPTGLAASDPAASNDTAEGKARNRRVEVNILVSKSVDGF